MPAREDLSASDRALWQSYAKRVRRDETSQNTVGNSKTGNSKKVFKNLGISAQASDPLARRECRLAAQTPVARALFPGSHKGSALSRSSELTDLSRKPLLFDRKSERQLRDGRFVIDRRLDLHGMTQTQAHHALAQFVASQYKGGKRRLLIITGKGRGHQGVLKAHLITWLEALPESEHILTLRPAAARHGGDGAFYLLFKRGARISKHSSE